MKTRGLVVASVAGLLAAAWAVGAWRDTHPKVEMTRRSLKSFSVAVPVSWPQPEEEGAGVFMDSAPNPGNSLDQYRWSISILDKGPNVDTAAVVAELQKGYDRSEPLRSIKLDNGITAQTWVDWEPLGEFNREVRAYVFKGGNGRVYTVLQPLGRDWRTNRRYTHIFRQILGSIEFKGV